jgi:hypothetical protein
MEEIMPQENTHAVICDYAMAVVDVLPLPLADKDIPDGWDFVGTCPSKKDAWKAATELGQTLDPEFCGSIH